MASVPMSEKRSIEPTPLGRFLEQYSKDLESKVSRGLLEYLQLFPGDPEHIAEEFLALKRFREQVDEAPQSATPAQISHYRIVKELGRGGQGVVYLAKDMKLGREVAIKMLRRSRLDIDELERLQREARIASRLDHPGICPIYEIGDYGGEPYVVMRYVRGTSLSHRISQNKETSATTFTFVDVSDADLAAAAVAAADAEAVGSPRKPTEKEKGKGQPTPSGKDLHTVLRLIEQVARALHEAHEARIVHRDVKPGNIIVTPEGQPVLLDFGVATMAQEGGIVVTRTGETPGTPPYMSPEQASGKRVPLDRRSDVYSLGVTLYECLTLKLPFSDTSDYARQIMFVPAPDPRTINPAISKDLKIVIDTALEKDRDRRYQTAADFADDLRRVRDHEPIRARPIGLGVKLLRWVQRNPAIATAIISIIAILTAALIVVAGLLHETRVAREAEQASTRELDVDRLLSAPLADLQRVQSLDRREQDLWPIRPDKLSGMKAWIEDAEHLGVRTGGYEEALQAGGASPDLSEEDRRRRLSAIDDLLPKLRALPGRVHRMIRRTEAAKTIEARTIISKRRQWDEIAAMIDSDPRFASIRPFKPQMGLIPLGRNEAGFFEFAVAESGDSADARPQSRPRESYAAATVVLLPGGNLTFDQGPDPATREPVPEDFVQTQVPPYFLGKYEVNQFQWNYVMDGNPSFCKDQTVKGVDIDDRHPVENVTWIAATEFCRRLGARLPTQDEWEFGARSAGGLEFGDCDERRCLEHRENLCDLTYVARLQRSLTGHMPWRDQYVLHAPVGSFQPNAFGLYDMLGNVSEWCSDRWLMVREPSDRQPSELPEVSDRRVYRGANYVETSREASCRVFRGRDPEGKMPQLGLRIARSIER